MSKGKPSGQAQEIAARGFGTAGFTLHIPDAPPAPDTAELIARFQIDTEALIAELRKSHQGQIATMERKVAGLDDQWTAAKAELASIRTVIEAALHEMRGGVSEALNSQREAVNAATKAASAAAVFDKLKASQPDFHRLVGEVQKKLGAVEDKIVNVEGTMHHLSKRLDEFDLVAEDYEETKTTVRGLDPIVGRLDKEAVQRRQTGVAR